MNEKIIIGLTGNIGAGKTTVLNMLRRHGAEIIDADAVAHKVMLPGGRAYRSIVADFGKDVLGSGQAVDRRKLGQLVFTNPEKLAHLEQILHPIVIDEVEHMIDASHAQVVVVEAIKLLEAGMASALCDQIWVVTSPVEQQIERLMTSRNMSRQEAEARMMMQSPQAYKVRHADRVIDNSGSLADLERQVDAAWQSLHLLQHA